MRSRNPSQPFTEDHRGRPPTPQSNAVTLVAVSAWVLAAQRAPRRPKQVRWLTPPQVWAHGRMLEPEPGSRSSINHCDHACQRCSEKHIANMARVGVLLPMGECHTQPRERGRPYAGLDVVGEMLTAGSTPTATQRAHPSSASRGRSCH